MKWIFWSMVLAGAVGVLTFVAVAWVVARLVDCGRRLEWRRA